jgi:hypothetical protein
VLIHHHAKLLGQIEEAERLRGCRHGWQLIDASKNWGIVRVVIKVGRRIDKF